MQPMLAESFTQSSRWTALSEPAQCALQGLLQFATRKHCDWIVDGSPKQIADWIGPEVRMAPTAIINGLRELATAGVVKRGHRGPSGETVYIVAVPLVDHVTSPAPRGVQERPVSEVVIKVKAVKPSRQRKTPPVSSKRAIAVGR
jgi:hypothetical protein